MVTREELVMEIEKRGYNVSCNTFEKFGRKEEGIVIKGEGNMSPVVYVRHLLEKASVEGLSVEELADEVIKIIGAATPARNFDLKGFLDKEYIFKNTFVGVQKINDNEGVKGFTDYEGIETFLYTRVDGLGVESGTIRLKQTILTMVGINENELWERAEENTFAETEIGSMNSYIANHYGISEEDVVGLGLGLKMVILSNKSKVMGASAMLDRKALEKIAEDFGTSDLIIIPSSRHEVLVLPYTEGMSLEEVNEMVLSVNSTELAYEDILSERAYRIEV